MSSVGPVVLFIDDDPDTRDMYQVALPLFGLTTLVAADVDEAVQQLAQVQPDVIVTDLSLSGASEACELIRRAQGTPVIVLTGWSEAEQTARAREAGCVAVLTKPCAPDSLVAVVRSVLSAVGR